MVSTTSRIVRMQAAGEHRLAPPGDAVRHQHRLGRRRSSRRTSRRWRPPCRSARDLGLELEQVSAACPARSPADRACRTSGTRSAGSGGRRSPARGGDRRRRRRRTAPSPPPRSSPPGATSMRSTSISLLARRQVERRSSRLSAGMSANSASMPATPIARQHLARDRRIGEREIAHRSASRPRLRQASCRNSRRRPRPSGRRARRVGELELEEPALARGILVDQCRARRQARC